MFSSEYSHLYNSHVYNNNHTQSQFTKYMVNYIQAHTHTHMYINIITLITFKYFVILTEYITDSMAFKVFSGINIYYVKGGCLCTLQKDQVKSLYVLSRKLPNLAIVNWWLSVSQELLIKYKFHWDYIKLLC